MAQKNREPITLKDFPIIELNIEDIRDDPTNPNVLTLEQQRGLEKSMMDFGRLKYIVVDQDNRVIDGTHRLEVEKAVGTKRIQVIQVNVKDEAERKLMRETLNLLHGTYDRTKQSEELLYLFENKRLDELAELLGKSNLEDFRQTISRNQAIDILNLNDDPENKSSLTGALSQKYGLPPFTVLDATSQRWRERKNKWLEFGLASHQGRDHVKYFNNKLLNYSLPTVSVYDPVLCEIMYRWFTPKQHSKVLDPFAGGTTRGVIASFLGHEYISVDLSQKQIDANEEQYEKLKHRMPRNHIKPQWLQGDSLELTNIIKDSNDSFDMLQTSPPYFLQEQYSKDEKDLNMIKSFDEFLDKYLKIIDESCKLLKQNGSFVVWNTTNTRDKNTGEVTNIIYEITNRFRKHGFMLLNDIILLRAIGSLQMMAPMHFKNKRYLGQRHENVMVYFRGRREEIPKIDQSITSTDVFYDEQNNPIASE